MAEFVFPFSSLVFWALVCIFAYLACFAAVNNDAGFDLASLSLCDNWTRLLLIYSGVLCSRVIFSSMIFCLCFPFILVLYNKYPVISPVFTYLTCFAAVGSYLSLYAL